MTKFLFSIITLSVLVAGCSGPIETRVQTQMAAALPEQKQYSFPAAAENENKLYGMTRKLVSTALEKKGFAQHPGAAMLVHIALSDRPANIAITVGDKEKTVLAHEKKQKPLQSCDDQEHRLTINIINAADGAELYTGTAAEYHCKGSFERSLRHLVKAALADLDRSGGINDEVKIRMGVD